ncbi:unnamed protein product [Calypogeia fissa]
MDSLRNRRLNGNSIQEPHFSEKLPHNKELLEKLSPRSPICALVGSRKADRVTVAHWSNLETMAGPGLVGQGRATSEGHGQSTGSYRRRGWALGASGCWALGLLGPSGTQSQHQPVSPFGGPITDVRW